MLESVCSIVFGSQMSVDTAALEKNYDGATVAKENRSYFAESVGAGVTCAYFFVTVSSSIYV